ncbi:MAG: glutaredoxin family protein [Neisseriaceae bacterium]|jgi:hypothetical protein|nr:hypothetical protein [Pseudomonadota bacterium]RTL00528.1 MAG: glutaredoxin family protein [Neisseriaceae bacterium]
MTKAHLSLMFREYCSLCQAMLLELESRPDRGAFQLDVIDVDEDPELEARYDELVPVLLAGDVELCHYHMDHAALDAYLASIR